LPPSWSSRKARNGAVNSFSSVKAKTSRYVWSPNQIRLFLAPKGESKVGVTENPSCSVQMSTAASKFSRRTSEAT
jgi:hypothetical protein